MKRNSACSCPRTRSPSGVLRGALEMVQMRVECSLTKDALWGDEVTEIRVVLKEMMEEEYVDDDGVAEAAAAVVDAAVCRSQIGRRCLNRRCPAESMRRVRGCTSTLLSEQALRQFCARRGVSCYGRVGTWR